MLDQQSIQDARLFDSTLVVYTSLLTPPASTATATTTTAPVPAAAGAPTTSAIIAPGGYYNPTTGVAVTAIKWDTALTVAWHEEFLNDPAKADPFAGQDPVVAASKLAGGDVISTSKSFKPFISASDRYVVVSRDVTRTVFTGTQTEMYSYCAKSHDGPARAVRSCSPKYEQRPNPDYRPPQDDGRRLLVQRQDAARLHPGGRADRQQVHLRARRRDLLGRTRTTTPSATSGDERRVVPDLPV